MIYREFLVMRKALSWYLAVVVALTAWVLGWLLSSPSAGPHTSTDLNQMAVPVAWCTSIFAGIFGVALGNGSREPSRLLWSLPFPRWRFALGMVYVDLIAIAIAFAGTFALSVLLFAVLALRGPVVIRGSIDWWSVATALAFLFAVYGWSALVGMAGRHVAYLGIAAFPVLFLWMAFARSQGPIGETLRAPLFINPIAVYEAAYQGSQLGAVGDAIASIGPGWKLAMLAGIALAGCAASIYLWKRAEVLP